MSTFHVNVGMNVFVLQSVTLRFIEFFAYRCVGNRNENLKLLYCQVPKRTREKDRHNTRSHKKLTVSSLLLRFRANSQTLLLDKAPFLNGKTMHIREC